MRSRARFRDCLPPSDGIPGRHKEENMAAKISGGRDEMGWRACEASTPPMTRFELDWIPPIL